MFSLAGPHVGGDIFSMAQEDFNGDGIPDFAALAFGIEDNAQDLEASVSVFLGNGDGTFKAPVNYPAGPGITVMVAARLRGPDAPVDLIVADSNPNGVSGDHPILVLLGNGDGSFQVPQTVVATLSDDGAAGMAVGDFNEDGKLDLAAVTALFPRSIVVLPGRGDGTFEAPRFSPTLEPTAPLSPIVAGDFNRDGHLDLLGQGGAYFFLGNGDGSFHDFIATGVRLDSAQFAVADFNGDGTLDLAVNTTSVFDPITGFPFFKTELDVYLGTGIGAFILSDSHDLRQPNQPGRGFIATADLDGDGTLDLVATTGPEGTIAVLFGNGNGTFRSPVTYPMAELQGTSFSQPLLFIADLNRDGEPDVVTASNLADLGNLPDFSTGVGINYLTVMLNQGRGAFALPQRFKAAVPINENLNDVLSDFRVNSYDVALGDFNGDGRSDLVVTELGCPLASPADNPLQVLLGFIARRKLCEPGSVAVLLGNGDGTFQAAQQFGIRDSNPFGVAVGDLTGDGNQDLVTANANSNTISLLKGNGDGTFQPAIPIPVGAVPETPVLGDFDGDGKPDIAVTNLTDNSISVLLNRSTPGTLAFADAVNVPVGAGPVSVVAGDFDGDGTLDLATVNIGDVFSLTGPSTLSVLRGNGDGTFRPASTQELFPEFGADGLAMGDFTGNGQLDLAVAHFERSQVLVLRGHGDGTFTPADTYQVGKGPEDLQAADINGDRKLDLVTTDINDNTVALLLGKGDGTFVPAADNTSDELRAFGWPAFAFPAFLAIGDLTGDGKPDLVVTNPLDLDGTVTVLQNTTPTLLPPIAQLVANLTQGAAPLTVSFDASGSRDPNNGGAIAQYTFDFGDGSSPVTQAAPVVTHTYQTAGTFQPTVTVTDSERGTAVATLTITVTSGSGGTPPPSGSLAAHLTANHLSGTAPLAVSFDASGSTGNISRYTFNFGDGSAEQTGASPTASHTYSQVGSFSASVTVFDDQGANASQAIVITVQSGGAAEPPPPVASLAVTPASGPAPLVVAFDASGSHDPAGGTLQSYTFDFGDGSAVVTRPVSQFGVNAPLTSHTYVTPGTYTPSLTVTNDSGVVSPSPAKAQVEATGPASKGGGALGLLTLLPLVGIGLARRKRR